MFVSVFMAGIECKTEGENHFIVESVGQSSNLSVDVICCGERFCSNDTKLYWRIWIVYSVLTLGCLFIYHCFVVVFFICYDNESEM